MAGILDTKQRVMDTLVTSEGRRQIASGELQIKFVSFTDRHTFYQSTGSQDPDVAEDASGRLFFEAHNRPQDQIIFETDNHGRFLPFKGGSIELFGDGRLRYGATGSIVDASGNVLTGSYLLRATGSQVINLVSDLMVSSSNNFKEQNIIGTKEFFKENSNFTITPASDPNGEPFTFVINNTHPFKEGDITIASVDNVESMWQDERLQHLPHYKYMPPTNKRGLGEQIGSSLGTYTRLNQHEMLTFEQLETRLSTLSSIDIEFTDTSDANNRAGQLVEAKLDQVTKLAVIDYGEFPSSDPFSPGKHVFFAGKIFMDKPGFLTFVNLFTLVFE